MEFPAPETQPSACGYVTYDSDMLFADVINLSFYVKGPYRNATVERHHLVNAPGMQ